MNDKEILKIGLKVIYDEIDALKILYKKIENNFEFVKAIKLIFNLHSLLIIQFVFIFILTL